MVAGHRRLKACIELNIKYLVNIHFEKNFEEAIKWQLAENMHEELPLLDLINSATSLWVLLKKQYPKLTLINFAKNYIHKSVSWLSSALKFIRLPLSIQDLIKKSEINKGVNYSIMLEFAKLYDFSVARGKTLDEEILLAYVNHCIAHKFNLEKVKKFCVDRRDELLGQQSLFLLSMVEVDKNSLKAIKAKTTRYLSETQIYLKTSKGVATQIQLKKAELVLFEGAELGKILESR